jgi:hypothetical protein
MPLSDLGLLFNRVRRSAHNKVKEAITSTIGPEEESGSGSGSGGEINVVDFDVHKNTC